MQRQAFFSSACFLDLIIFSGRIRYRGINALYLQPETAAGTRTTSDNFGQAVNPAPDSCYKQISQTNWPIIFTDRMNTPEKSTSRYGIRVSLAPSDPFTALVGEDWQKTHWFTAQTERDRVMRDMAREHEYSRRGDKPTLIFEAVSRTTDS